ncbi:hypothetical protein DICVIV_13798 [Dictyocaulus viviparus]|uniref:Uncharacterized protein n=1 Tax=Dictyocaulus viviparus TaxID=29172 RepID=A0A0D8XCX0_DICVI|nr:hypothetical protein DICVIV_13798 [Dictyocaulus viviparus]
MNFFNCLNVIQGTFLFLIFLETLWVVWTTISLFNVFNIAEVPFHFTLLVILCGVSFLGSCVTKLIACFTRSVVLDRLTVFLLIVNLISHIVFLLMVIISVDTHFGLHFYYDLPLVSTILTALDLCIFPYFVISEYEEVERKEK